MKKCIGKKTGVEYEYYPVYATAEFVETMKDRGFEATINGYIVSICNCKGCYTVVNTEDPNNVPIVVLHSGNGISTFYDFPSLEFASQYYNF